MIDINIILPILDIQVKVENNKIIYKFYKKPVSSPLLMLERSAMPMKIKRNTLAEEGLWRLRNTKRDLAWEIKADILSEFSFSMMLSSYSEKVRCEIIQSVLTGYERQCDRADRGISPLHRPRDYNTSTSTTRRERETPLRSSSKLSETSRNLSIDKCLKVSGLTSWIP